MSVHTTASAVAKSVSLCVLLVLCAAPAFAAASAEGFIKDRQQQLTKLLKAPETPATQQKIDGIVDAMFDYSRLARESLGAEWGRRSDAERQEFESLFRRLVKRAYRKNLKKTLDYEVIYKREVKGNDTYRVETVAKHRTDLRKEPISIVYVLRKAGDTYKVADVETEKSSLLMNYKRQFARVLKKDGWAGLIRRMKKKLS